LATKWCCRYKVVLFLEPGSEGAWHPEIDTGREISESLTQFLGIRIYKSGICSFHFFCTYASTIQAYFNNNFQQMRSNSPEIRLYLRLQSELNFNMKKGEFSRLDHLTLTEREALERC
jgi:hypothetical protein